jgi:hypothetical protein
MISFRLAATLCAAAICSTSASAQTFDEAVRTNIWLATQACLDTMISREAANVVFGSADFTYRAFDRGVNEFGIDRGRAHYFEAPAETARAQVDTPDGIAGICHVFSVHLSEAELAAVMRAVVFQSHPGARVREPNQLLIDTPSGLPLIVTTRTVGTNNRYETPGTTTVAMGYPG